MDISLLPYEHHREPLAPHPVFLRRVLLHLAMAISLISVSLGIGILGYSPPRTPFSPESC
jgi:hypothetical protein